jgi:hypothetical protein
MKQVTSRLTFGGQHGVISQKTEFFITTAVRTSDLQDTYLLHVLTYFIIEPAEEFEQTIEVKLNSSKNS